MKNFLLVPDSFKGTISSREICDILTARIRAHIPQAGVFSIPVADGGEGSVDCFLTALGGKRVELTVKGPRFEEVRAFYGRLPDGTAVVEMAACAGLPLMKGRKDPLGATTYGVGQLISDAVENGARHIILALGGSATNDMGAGAAAALGVKFFNREGEPFIPTGGTLHEVVRVDASGLNIGKAYITAMCDIDNPLCGENGAAYVYGPQKGADPEMIRLLDAGMAHLAQVVARDLGKDVLAFPGSGAAGGMGAGAYAFLGASLCPGIDTVLDAVNFDALLQQADCVITGEGRIDAQSLRGKVVVGVARRCQKHNVPVIALVGDVGPGAQRAYEQGVTAIFSTNRLAKPLDEAKKTAKEDLTAAAEDLIRLLARVAP